ncbi:hypothetical protein BDN70DRAFT_902152, partial [Pholiota conissans]
MEEKDIISEAANLLIVRILTSHGYISTAAEKKSIVNQVYGMAYKIIKGRVEGITPAPSGTAYSAIYLTYQAVWGFFRRICDEFAPTIYLGPLLSIQNISTRKTRIAERVQELLTGGEFAKDWSGGGHFAHHALFIISQHLCYDKDNGVAHNLDSKLGPQFSTQYVAFLSTGIEFALLSYATGEYKAIKFSSKDCKRRQSFIHNQIQLIVHGSNETRKNKLAAVQKKMFNLNSATSGPLANTIQTLTNVLCLPFIGMSPGGEDSPERQGRQTGGASNSILNADKLRRPPAQTVTESAMKLGLWPHVINAKLQLVRYFGAGMSEGVQSFQTSEECFIKSIQVELVTTDKICFGLSNEVWMVRPLMRHLKKQRLDECALMTLLPPRFPLSAWSRIPSSQWVAMGDSETVAWVQPQLALDPVHSPPTMSSASISNITAFPEDQYLVNQPSNLPMTPLDNSSNTATAVTSIHGGMDADFNGTFFSGLNGFGNQQLNFPDGTNPMFNLSSMASFGQLIKRSLTLSTSSETQFDLYCE